MSLPVLTPPPAHSRIAALLAGESAGALAHADFHDSWQITVAEPGLTALGQFRQMFARTPRWVDRCMQLRNAVVRRLGLKDLGSFHGFDPDRPESDYQPGERLGIFTLFSNSPEELLVGDHDRHLDVTLSFHLNPERTVLTVTTVVQVKNWLGRLYLLPVIPMHKLIAPATLRGVASA